MRLGQAHVIRADSRALPIPDNTVDLVVTSPPYFALRSYQDGGCHYQGQIGDEPTPAEFVDSLLEVTRECVRVLKPTGSLWVNLGDKYVSTPPGNTRSLANSAEHQEKQKKAYDANWRVPQGFRQKSLIGIPWRYALRCIDDLGLILRAEVIWSKPNGLPESVTDRVRRSHETWFHFTLSPRYYSAVDEIRERYAPETVRTGQYAENSSRKRGIPGIAEVSDASSLRAPSNPLGKLPGSVWTVPTEPLRVPDHLGVDHFAAFPTEWPKRIIQGWSPAGVCVECGEGRRPVVARGPGLDAWRERNKYDVERGDGGRIQSIGGQEWNRHKAQHPDTLTGYACACPEPTAPTTPGVVLDPFGGTGTTAMVAKALGRTGISVDMSADYCRLAQWRVNDRDQLAKVLGIEKTTPVHTDEVSLLDLLGDS